MGPSWGSILHIILATSPDHELFRVITLEFCDEVWKRDRGPGLMTRWGWFPEAEIQAAGGKVIEHFDRVTGEIELVAVFPRSYVMGIDGKPDFDYPIYAEPAPRINPFEKPPPNVFTESDWWDD